MNTDSNPTAVPLIRAVDLIQRPYHTVYGVNTCIPYPTHWEPYYNACNDPCDMIQGPCVCGATHSLPEWEVKKRPIPEPVEKYTEIELFNDLAKVFHELVEITRFWKEADGYSSTAVIIRTKNQGITLVARLKKFEWRGTSATYNPELED